MKKLLSLLLSVVFLLSGCGGVPSEDSSTEPIIQDSPPATQDHVANFVQVKYRSDAVDIVDPQFETVDTSKSSLVRGAWYDKGNQYMIIKLNSVYYHYCDMPVGVWMKFKQADSFGKTYQVLIKGRYDCRYGTVPSY